MNPEQRPSLPDAKSWASGDTPENGSKFDDARFAARLRAFGAFLILLGLALTVGIVILLVAR